MFDLIRFQCSVLKEIDRSLILFGHEKKFSDACFNVILLLSFWR